MKSSVFSLVLVAGLAAAQSSKLPDCASKCINEYTTGGKIAGCGQVDVKCICSNKDFLNGIACCLQSGCDTAGQEAAVKYAGQICSSAGVTVPSKLTCSSSSSGSSSGSDSATKSSSGSSATGDSTATGKAATGTPDSTGSSTQTATGSSASSTSSGSSAAGSYSASGLLGALAAVVFAL